jgi:hypothetical protein
LCAYHVSGDTLPQIRIMDNHNLLDLPFDQYQRYKAVQVIIEILDRSNGPILDVGGYSRISPGKDFLLLREFMPRRDVLVLDRSGSREAGYLQGDGLALPFADASFPFVVSVDTLEHIPSHSRKSFWSELLRVTRDYLILAAPFHDERVALSERIIYELTELIYGTGQVQIGEHLTNGLPQLNESRDTLSTAGWHLVEIPNGYLHNWLLMMTIYYYLLSIPEAVSLNRTVSRFYNGSFFESDNRSPAYRQILVATPHKDGQIALERVREHFTSAAKQSQGDTSTKLALFQLLTKIIEIDLYNQALTKKERENAALRETIRRYEQGRFIKTVAWLDKLKRRLLNRGR